MTTEMQAQLKIEKRGLREATKELKVYSDALSETLTKLMSDDSPLPEFRDKFRAKVEERNQEIAMQVFLKQITMREARAKCRELQDRLVQLAWCIILQDPRMKPAVDALGRVTYHTIRRDAILNGETVATFNT